MFNVLVSADKTAWDVDQLMRMTSSRFKEHSTASEAESISTKQPSTLKALEEIPTLLIYEMCASGPNSDVVRFGTLRKIRLSGSDILCSFREEGRIPRSVIVEFANHLQIDSWELNRTHWAIKDGDIPKQVMSKIGISYDVVFSFAGENRDYVEEVVRHLKSNGVRVFYDRDEEANLWGRNLVEYFDAVYRKNAKYCVMFISKPYVEKVWTRHERRAALSRAIVEREEYVLPARFDDTEVPGLAPTVAYVSLNRKSPEEFGALILEKLGKA